MAERPMERVEQGLRLYLAYDVMTVRQLASILRAYDLALDAAFRAQARRLGVRRLAGLALPYQEVSTAHSIEVFAHFALAATTFNAIGGPLLDWRQIARTSLHWLGMELITLTSPAAADAGRERAASSTAISDGDAEYEPLAVAVPPKTVTITGPRGSGLAFPAELLQNERASRRAERFLKSLLTAELKQAELEAIDTSERFTLAINPAEQQPQLPDAETSL